MADAVPTMVSMMAHYKAWADDTVFSIVAGVPEAEALKPRQSVYTNMVHTLNHIYVIDSIFRAHLEGRPHGYTARNTPATPPLGELHASVREQDRWFVDYYAGLSDARAAERVAFQFVGGGDGNMSRLEILMHLVNHGTYHRGFVGDMLNQAGVRPRPTDLTVFLRDVWQVPRAA